MASEFFEEIIQLDRVTRVQKGGRRMRFRATVVVGNRKGKVGIGMGKSVEVVTAIQKAVAQAKKNLLRVSITETGTLPHEISLKFKASKILILPAAEGTGIIAGSSLRTVLDLAGYKNVLAKRLGSTNRINNAQAALYALAEIKS
ncbi:MAG: 30S ribosomal protein S5 [Patescibacteria group bacterium]|nr:30S ribosomal protein S5 [Patescibacteria group bacterium]